MVKDAFKIGPSNRRSLGKGGFLSMEMTYKPSIRPPIRRPAEEQVERNVVCPHCGLNHSVYGLATWCADCGKDIFLTHVDAELAVVKAMLGDIERRREVLGSRIAAKDLENCLEDTVSIFEAVLKIIIRRAMMKKDIAEKEIDRLIRQIGSGFQSVHKTKEFLIKNLQIPGFPELSSEEVDNLFRIFEKRHPITHNLGVIDRKYIEKVSSSESEGREVNVTKEEISQAIDMIQRVFSKLINA
jgi:DNA-directed RNA polymerase subunit RPC12/RpoP